MHTSDSRTATERLVTFNEPHTYELSNLTGTDPPRQLISRVEGGPLGAHPAGRLTPAGADNPIRAYGP